MDCMHDYSTYLLHIFFYSFIGELDSLWFKKKMEMKKNETGGIGKLLARYWKRLKIEGISRASIIKRFFFNWLPIQPIRRIMERLYNFHVPKSISRNFSWHVKCLRQATTTTTIITAWMKGKKKKCWVLLNVGHVVVVNELEEISVKKETAHTNIHENG